LAVSDTDAAEIPESETGRLTRLRAADGWYLALRDFSAETSQPGRPVILGFAAMGAPARAYRRLARWFANQGYPVATLDTRGTGESTPIPRRGIDFGVSQHLYQDWPAAIAWARATHPGRPIVLLGHSIGGQLSGLHAGGKPDGIAALVLLTTTSVWWKSSRSWKRRVGALIMFSVFATTARLLGWFPGHRFNWGLPLARQVVLDWAHWGFSGNYFDTERRNLDAVLADVKLPALSISFSDDIRLAPKGACDDFVRRMPQAQLTRWHLTPQEIGLEEASHFTHLRGAPLLWQRIDRWLQQAISRPAG
jgi:predicted alpha/beta hydrolase